MSTEDEELRLKALSEVLAELSKRIPERPTPGSLNTRLYRIVKRVTGVEDPYREKKKLSNKVAKRVVDHIRKNLDSIEDDLLRFKEAVSYAIAGNMIDFGIPSHRLNMEKLDEEVEKVKGRGLAIDDTEEIFKAARGAKVVYLIDNAGEAVFDGLLVRELKRLGAEVVVVAKGGPVSNDATLEDAVDAGLGELADRLATTGKDAVGLGLPDVNPELMSLLKSANLIISKGQGNLEDLTEIEGDVGRPVAYLLNVKCDIIAGFLGVKKGDAVAKLSKPRA